MRKWENWTPMGVLAVAVAIGITGIIVALIISVVNGGPPDALSEGVFAVLSAAIGAVAGYSVASREPTSHDVSDDDIDYIEEDDEFVDDAGDDEFVDDDGDFVAEDVAAPSQDWIADAQRTGDDRA